MYARVRIGNAAIELGEAEGGAASMPGGFFLQVIGADAAFERAIAAGAKPLSPPEDRADGGRVGSVEDSMGNHWFITRPS